MIDVLDHTNEGRYPVTQIGTFEPTLAADIIVGVLIQKDGRSIMLTYPMDSRWFVPYEPNKHD